MHIGKEEMNSKTKTDIVIYKKGGSAKIDVRLSGETIWLNLNQMAKLFARDKSVIAKHIRNIYREKELQADSTVALFATVQKEGKRLPFPGHDWIKRGVLDLKISCESQ
ncbi:hypothetical protein JNL27_05120 [bacterium]|nr:hypothetical protein [bacterium]